MAKVSMYTISTCPVCRKTKEFFRARGIPFDFVDFDLASESEQNKIAAEMMKGAGDIGFPFVRIGDIVVVGFNPERFEQLLRSEKLEPAPTRLNEMVTMEGDIDIFSQYRMGDLTLPNRIVMAPMTRNRAGDADVPVSLTVTYYVQRASAGMIITEGSQVSPQGVGYVHTPGIYSAAQVAGWKKVTDAVHRAGGRIFIQLWHVGRVSHPDLLDGTLPVAPSALPVEGSVHTPGGKKQIPVPRALKTDEVPDIIRQFRQAAENARTAGFDGVEIHGANGYLLDQFLRSGSNKRTDEYGGSLENRVRLPLEVTKAVIEVWGGNRVGYRISPHNTGHSMSDVNPEETFSYFTRELNKTGLGYLHLIEPIGGRMGFVPAEARLGPTLRRIFENTLILNGGYDLQSGNEAIARGEADLIAFGVPFLANPDLPERFRQNAPLNKPDVATFYVGGEKGYTDYPTLVHR